MSELLQSKIVKFLLIAGGAYVLWLFSYYFIIKEYTTWDYNLNLNIVELSRFFLKLFGTEAILEIESDHVIILMQNGNSGGVWVGDECNGFKLFSIFSIFIIAFPGNWKNKLWYIPTGLILIHFANILRVSALLIISDSYPAYLDFNHLYTFTIFVYGIIFLLWYIYAKKIQ